VTLAVIAVLLFASPSPRRTSRRAGGRIDPFVALRTGDGTVVVPYC
jgi:hypothetical protein